MIKQNYKGKEQIQKLVVGEQREFWRDETVVNLGDDYMPLCMWNSLKCTPKRVNFAASLKSK